MYSLRSENLTGLGAPMGQERTWTNWIKFYKTLEAAKKAAERDYGLPIKWSQRKSPTKNFVPIDLICSGDLGYVMYHIQEINTED